MRSHFRRPASKPFLIAWVLILLVAALVCVCAGTAKASYYKMLLCAGGDGAGEYATETNTILSGAPYGYFLFEDHCGGVGDPAGNGAYLRIVDRPEKLRPAQEGQYGRFAWTAPEGVEIASAGGYTREPEGFSEGWRARYWAEGFDGSANNILLQGSGIAEPTKITKPRTTTFASHLWPFPALGSYRRFSFELICVREAGCEKSGENAADSNTILLTLNDSSPPAVTVAEGPLAGGGWVKGTQPISWTTTEIGSGVSDEHVRVDGADRVAVPYSCNLGQTEASGEFARSFKPCPRSGTFAHSAAIDTTSLADGAHSATVCAQDYGQAQGLDGSGGESCVARTIHTDNTAPAAPLSLAIGSANPARYESTFSASWSLAPDPGSPIAKVHYWITDAAGNVVVPEAVVAATNPTGLPAIAGPATPGAYLLHIALEDEVGFVGAAATVAIPHDTIPPAAPQDISVTPPSASRTERGFDVEWQNILDSGSPIVAAHYEITDAAGKVVVAERTLTGQNPEAIPHLATPRQGGDYRLLLWLSDAEGNVGAPVSAPLSFDCVRSDVKGAVSLSAGFGSEHRNRTLVSYGSGAAIAGRLLGAGARELAGAPVCVYGRIVTAQRRKFLGIALTDGRGDYAYPVPPGASREIVVENRPGQRIIRSAATIVTRARPTIELVSEAPVHNGSTAVFSGRLPGPESGSVPLVLQVKDGPRWLDFSTASTNADGSYEVAYRVTHTFSPVTFEVRVLMPPQHEVPYHSGASEPIDLPVRP